MTKNELVKEIREGRARELDLRGVDLSGKNLTGVDCGGVDFSGANLEEVNFGWANLVGANFSGANLRNANFKWANVEMAIFTDADCRGVNFEKVIDIDTAVDVPIMKATTATMTENEYNRFKDFVDYVCSGDLPKIVASIHDGVDVSALDGVCLDLAMANGDTTTVALLIGAGVKINSRHRQTAKDGNNVDIKAMVIGAVPTR